MSDPSEPVVRIVRAFQRGDVVVVTYEQWLLPGMRDSIRETLEKLAAETGVRFVIFEGGAKIAGREETCAR